MAISDDFKGMNVLERLETIGLAMAEARIMEPIEPLAYTEEEFSLKDRGTFVRDEAKSGPFMLGCCDRRRCKVFRYPSILTGKQLTGSLFRRL